MSGEEHTFHNSLARRLRVVAGLLSDAPRVLGFMAEYEDVPEDQFHAISDHIYDALSSLQHALHDLTREDPPCL